MDERKQEGTGPSPWAAYAVYGGAGVQLAVAVVAGYWVGQYADERFGTTPWIAIAGIALGFIGGLMNLVRIVQSLERDRGKGAKR